MDSTRDGVQPTDSLAGVAYQDSPLGLRLATNRTNLASLILERNHAGHASPIPKILME